MGCWWCSSRKAMLSAGFSRVLFCLALLLTVPAQTPSSRSPLADKWKVTSESVHYLWNCDYCGWLLLIHHFPGRPWILQMKERLASLVKFHWAGLECITHVSIEFRRLCSTRIPGVQWRQLLVWILSLLLTAAGWSASLGDSNESADHSVIKIKCVPTYHQ